MEFRRWDHNDKVFQESFYAEFQYKGSKWKEEGRIVVVRGPKANVESNDETTKQTGLFTKMDEPTN
jgi:hypothetical protein